MTNVGLLSYTYLSALILTLTSGWTCGYSIPQTTFSQMKKSTFQSAVYNSGFWSSSWFPWSVTVPSLTLLYFKPAEWDNLLGEKEVSKPALFWHRASPENVFLSVERYELYIKTSVDDCKIFTNTTDWKQSHTEILLVKQNTFEIFSRMQSNVVLASACMKYELSNVP